MPITSSTSIRALVFISSLTLARCVFGLDVTDIEAAWKDRIRELDNFEVVLKGTQLYQKGAMNGLGEANEPKLGDYPNKDFTVPISYRITVTQDNLRIEENRKEATKEFKQWHDAKSSEVYIGTYYRRLVQSELPQNLHKILGLIEIRENGGPTYNDVPPILWAIPINTYNLINLEEIELLPKQEIVGGRSCVVLVSKSGKKSWWCDAERDFALVRYVQRDSGEIEVQWTINFVNQKHELLGWIPKQWKMTSSRQGIQVPIMTTELNVAEIKLNCDLPAEAFDLTFPPGAIVFDRLPGAPKGAYVQE